MHLLKLYAFLLWHAFNILCADGYIMPICSENGGVCPEKTANGDCTDRSNLKATTNVSGLFSFVTGTVEVTKRWMYDQVFTVYRLFYKEPEAPPKQISYFEAMLTFLGLRKEPKKKEIEYPSCNPYVFGVILTFYFGYVLMAAKCFSARKSSSMSIVEKPGRIFFPFLARKNSLCKEEEEEESEDESTVVFQPKYAECNHSNLSTYLTGDDDEP